MKPKNIIDRLSLKGKLMLIITATSILGLLLSSVFFGLYQGYRAKQLIREDLTILARLIGDRSTAALVFDDQKSAEENLSSLRFRPAIADACIYDAEGRVFATYSSKNALGAFPKPDSVGLQPGKGRVFVIYEPILMEGKQIGSLLIRAGMEEVGVLWREFLLAASLILLCGGVVPSTFLTDCNAWFRNLSQRSPKQHGMSPSKRTTRCGWRKPAMMKWPCWYRRLMTCSERLNPRMGNLLRSTGASRNV